MNIYMGNNCIILNNGEILIEGNKLPPCPTKYNNIVIIGKKIYINGYEYKKGKWKKTLKAIWYKYF